MAKQRMLNFVTCGSEMPDKRPSTQRASDFNEIYQDYAAAKASQQASRCSQCGVPYCQTHCPLHNNIPDWLRLTAEGRFAEAYQLSQDTNSFPEICGRICPQDRLCEGNCVIEQSGHGTVTIGAIEKHLTDTAWEQGWVRPILPAAELAQSVAIIGAGPAGLAAADRLRRKGYQVTVYDRHDRAGGLLIYGIPGFKLEKHIIQRRCDQLVQGGVKFVLNTNIGTDISFDALRDRHDAVLIATGVYQPRKLDIALPRQSGLLQALDYLIAANRAELDGRMSDPAFSAKGRKVVVIGGGDTAMDCLRTAIRQGASSVKCLYRRDRANMPGSQREVRNAEEEGVQFQWQCVPSAVALNPDGAISGLTVQQMQMGPPDVSGRSQPIAIPGSSFHEPADLVIAALGFQPEDLPGLWAQDGLTTTRWGTVLTNSRSHATSLPGVYAAGDIARGASLVVWAIRDGREAADQIALDLNAVTQSSARIAAE